MGQDTRAYYTFYGINTDDWDITYGTLTDNNYILVKDYVSDAASVASSSAWSSSGYIFLYPHHIKKKYFLEGVVEGQITFTSESGANTSFVSDYRVSILKISSEAIETTLATTGVVAVNSEFPYDSEWHTGTDIVYPFWIDVYTEPKEITQNERIAVKVEWDTNNSSSTTAYLMHDNDSTYEDLKIIIPLLL